MEEDILKWSCPMSTVIHWQSQQCSLRGGAGKSQSSGSTKYMNFAVFHLNISLRHRGHDTDGLSGSPGEVCNITTE